MPHVAVAPWLYTYFGLNYTNDYKQQWGLYKIFKTKQFHAGVLAVSCGRGGGKI